ncbi:hypothetical protein [Halopseudomonas pelagia]|uniref:hypothetical protein n=1 Tax=Halopseudomonas pelagia TaxID=553151 RepID=UPI0003B3A3F4|nr:hypothetical protein [Halopseudomonas pelagia]
MARRRTPGLEWLDENDRSQRIWAVHHLIAKGIRTNRTRPEENTHQDMLEIGYEFEREIQARTDKGARYKLILRDMRDAWRQRRYHNRTDGRQICKFKIRTTTKELLAELAQKKGISEGDFLDEIIERSYTAMQRRTSKDTDASPLKPDLEKRPGLFEVYNFLNPEDPATSISDLKIKTGKIPAINHYRRVDSQTTLLLKTENTKNFYNDNSETTAQEESGSLELPNDSPTTDDHNDRGGQRNEQEDSSDQTSAESGAVVKIGISDTIMGYMSTQTRVKPNNRK